VAGTTSRAIANQSGVNLAGITYHFGSKDHLVAEAMLQAIREWLAPALHILRGDGDPVSRMIGTVQALQTSFEDASADLPVIVEALAQAPRNDAVRSGAGQLLAEVTTFLASQMEDLQRTGFLPPWIDPPSMAILLVGIGQGVALLSVIDPDRVDHRAVGAQVIQLLLSARAEPPPFLSLGAG
jgi:AcrR family transcriptional regulator